MKCVNCNGNHTAASKDCPRHQKEMQMLKIKNEKKLTYAEAVKQYNERTSGPTFIANAIQFNSSSLYADEFPPLPANHALPTHSSITNKDRTTHMSPTVPVSRDNKEIQTQVMNEVDFSSNFMFGNPIYFLAFLTEVINHTILATKADKNININEIISESAGKRIGIPINIDQLKSLI